ncbi:MAG: GDSL-type esterase/lipase family protein [Treponema sp.]|nr:GDSL-type esterase/lipase family protein [Treponema sp.]
MRKIILSLLTSALVFGSISCASKTTSSSESIEAAVETTVVTGPAAVKEFIPDSSNVKLLGRSFYDGLNLVMTYSSTGAEFNVSAKTLEVEINADSNGGRNADSAARIVAFVNGKRVLDEMLRSRNQRYTVFTGEALTEGVVQILKVSEATSSFAGISGIYTDEEGSVTPTEKKALKIEFIGDSITCGYGVDDPNRNNHFKTSTEDNTKTYAYKTAQMLDADYSMVSISGWGIISGYSGDGKKHGESALPAYYEKAAFSWGTTIDGYNPKDIAWDFNTFVPDVIVINLGTNDASYTKNDPEKCEEFKQAYIKFIEQVRDNNENAIIVCALGIMGQDLYPYVEAAVDDYIYDSWDEDVFALKFDSQLASDGICADWHPSEKTNQKAAVRLTNLIKMFYGPDPLAK